MAEGFVGLAFGVSGVFTLIDQCLTLYRHIHENRNFGENVWQQYVLFQHECTRFDSWQKEMRDFHTATRSHHGVSSRQQPSTPGLDRPNADELMHNTLAQIITILGAVKAICEKYKLDQLEKTKYTGGLKKADVANISTGLATTVIGSAVASDGQLAKSSLIKQQNETVLKRNTGLFKRILYGSKLWKESDKEEFQQLITKFAHWNNCLQDFLPSIRRMLLDLISSSTLLETEKDPLDLKKIHAAASAGLYESLARRAALRQAKLEPNLGPSFKRDCKFLDEKDIGGIVSLPRGVVTYSSPDMEPIKTVVEWKSYADLTDDDDIVSAEQHVEALVKLLSFGKKPATMAVLDSFGYFQYEDQDHRLFGFISAFPPKADITRTPASLNELLVDGKRQKRLYSLPSLPQRIRIAQSLAITLLELHNAEWLHKDINSRNIIFFYGAGSTLDFDKPFVSGFEYARPDDITAVSFSVRNSPMNMYRHPSLLKPTSPGQKRPRFQRIHDIYSLGLLLLEIGLWKYIGDFRKPDTKPGDFAKIVKQLAVLELPHRVGDIYRDVVLKCIDGEDLYVSDMEIPERETNEEGMNEEGLNDQERKASLVKFYWSVIRELERCHCK